MRSSLIVIAAIVGGIIIAWLMFAPSPEALPPAPAARAPVTASTPAPPAPSTNQHDDLGIPGPNPVNEAFHARINQPDAALSGMQGAAWAVIRRELAQQQKAELDAMIAESNDLVRDLREGRLRPDGADRDALARRQQELRQRIAEGGHTTPLMDEQFKRLDDLALGYALGGNPITAPPGQVPPAGAGTTSSGWVGMPKPNPGVPVTGGNMKPPASQEDPFEGLPEAVPEDN